MVAGHLQVKKDYYYMVLNLKDEQGKRKAKWLPTGIPATGKRNAKKAEELLLETRMNYVAPIVASVEIEGSKMTGDMQFADFMLIWLNIIKNGVEENTYAGYQSNVEKRIVPYFRKRKVTLKELNALDIEQFYAYCQNELKLKGSTIQHFHANIHKALKFALRHKLIAQNPMECVERPKAQKFSGAFYTAGELEQLFHVAQGDPMEFPILMAAFYGLRRSEIVGLRWQSIDFENNTISIDHTVVQYRVDGKQKIVGKDRTKNQSSCRTMPLVPQFRELLLRMKSEQAENRKLCGNCYTESDYIFVNGMGQSYTPTYVTQRFKKLLNRYGLRMIRFHDLRHSCASLLLKNGVHMKDIQDWLGHSDYSTTANIYAHLDTGTKKISAETMSQVLTISPELCSAAI